MERLSAGQIGKRLIPYGILSQDVRGPRQQGAPPRLVDTTISRMLWNEAYAGVLYANRSQLLPAVQVSIDALTLRI